MDDNAYLIRLRQIHDQASESMMVYVSKHSDAELLEIVQWLKDRNRQSDGIKANMALLALYGLISAMVADLEVRT